MDGLQTNQNFQPPLQRNSLIRVVSNNQIDAMEKAKEPPPAPQEVVSMLASHIRTVWENAKLAKRDIEEIMLRSKRAINGEYDPDKLAAIKEANSASPYMMITAQKVRDAKAWILYILQPSGDKPWTIDPTPQPDLSPAMQANVRSKVLNMVFAAAQAYMNETGQQVTQEEFNTIAQSFSDEILDMAREEMKTEAEKVANRMSAKIEDQLVEGNWQKAFREVVGDIVEYPAGIIESPIIKKRKTLNWIQDQTGKWIPDVKETIVLDFGRVSPYDMYPVSDSTDINGGDLIVRHRLTRTDLNELIGVPGYNDEEIRKVLNEYGQGGLREWLWTDSERVRLEQKNPQALWNSQKIDALRYWGSVQGKVLLDWGMTSADVPDPDIDYDIEAWQIGTHIIKAVLNPDPLGKKPYYKASFEEVAGSFWGRGVPELIADVQEICNASARALVNNMAIASGPQVEVDVDRMMPGEHYDEIWPWKVWRSTNKQMATGPAVRFYQPSMLAEQLMAVYEKFKNEADEQSGIPAFAHGDSQVGGAGNTASGLSMLMSSSARGIKQVVGNIDVGIIGPEVNGLYEFNMRYDDDETIKGDLRVMARGSSSLMAKEQLAVRRKELLAETNNPIDLQIMGLAGRKALLKEAVKSVEMPVDKIIPDRLPVQPSPAQTTAPPPAGGSQPSPSTPKKSAALDQAGNKVAGQDEALFNRKAVVNV